MRPDAHQAVGNRRIQHTCTVPDSVSLYYSAHQSSVQHFPIDRMPAYFLIWVSALCTRIPSVLSAECPAPQLCRMLVVISLHRADSTDSTVLYRVHPWITTLGDTVSLYCLQCEHSDRNHRGFICSSFYGYPSLCLNPSVPKSNLAALLSHEVCQQSLQLSDFRGLST